MLSYRVRTLYTNPRRLCLHIHVRGPMARRMVCPQAVVSVTRHIAAHRLDDWIYDIPDSRPFRTYDSTVIY